MRVVRFALCVVAASGCPAPPVTPPPDAGEVPDAAVPELPGCDAGRFRIGDGACVAAGWTACPQGFVDDGSGSGCAPIFASSCDAGSGPRLGEPGCTVTPIARRVLQRDMDARVAALKRAAETTDILQRLGQG